MALNNNLHLASVTEISLYPPEGIAFVTKVTSDLGVIAALLPEVPFDVTALINTEFDVCISKAETKLFVTIKPLGPFITVNVLLLPTIPVELLSTLVHSEYIFEPFTFS